MPECIHPPHSPPGRIKGAAGCLMVTREPVVVWATLGWAAASSKKVSLGAPQQEDTQGNKGNASESPAARSAARLVVLRAENTEVRIKAPRHSRSLRGVTLFPRAMVKMDGSLIRIMSSAADRVCVIIGAGWRYWWWGEGRGGEEVGGVQSAGSNTCVCDHVLLFLWS